MIFDKKTTIEAPELLVAAGKRLGFEPIELLQAGLRVAQASLLKGPTRTDVRNALEGRATGLLIVCGVTGSEYAAVAREIASMKVGDVTQTDRSPLLLDEMTTRPHVKAASVASHHCLVIATLHASDGASVRDRMTAILGQDVREADLDLIGVVETRVARLEPEAGFLAARSAIAVRFYPELSN
jgi:hypothetical protein